MPENICLIQEEAIVKCPLCLSTIDIKDESCKGCDRKIRRINVNRIKNSDFLRPVGSFDKDGNALNIYKNVYEIFPIDSKSEHKKRAKIIDVCNRKSRVFMGQQWRFVDCDYEVGKVQTAGSAKEIIQCDLSGKIMNVFSTMGEVSDTLGLMYSTISKACKNFIPPQNAEYFLFFKDDFCDYTLDKALNLYNRSIKLICVYDADNNLVGQYATYDAIAQALNVSATSVSSWCSGKHLPSGQYEGYRFIESNGIAKKIKIDSDCINRENVNCEISRINVSLKEIISQKEEEINALIDDNNKLNKIIEENRKEIKRLKNKYLVRKYRYETIIPFMCPIDIFIKEYTSRFTGAIIYILCDDNGKRYIGQSNRDDYSRIKEHFDGSQKDSVYEAYKGGAKFFVERIITGWDDPFPWNLNDAETYFISHFDSKDTGYNNTRGNHAYNSMKHEEQNP